MGSKNAQQSTTTTAPASYIGSADQGLVKSAGQLAQTPYTPYTGELTAGVNAQQNTGIAGINSASGIANPYIAQAANYAQAGVNPLSPTQFSAGQVGQYESPYQNDVINSTLATIQNNNAQQQQQLKSGLIGSGAFGGDRAGIASAALAGQQNLATNQTIAGLNNQNYTQALGEFNNQQQTGLQAGQLNNQNAANAAYTYGNLGTEAQNTALTGAGAQISAGTLQQQTQQAADQANYNQYLQALSFPYQQLAFQAGIDQSAASSAGGTSTGSQSVNSAGQIGGGILAGLGLLGSFLARGGPVKGYASGGGVGGIVMPYGGSGGMLLPVVQGGGQTNQPYAPNMSAPSQTPNFSGDLKAGQGAGAGLGKIGSYFGSSSFFNDGANPGSAASPLDGLDPSDYGGGMFAFREGGVVPRLATGGIIMPYTIPTNDNQGTQASGGTTGGVAPMAPPPVTPEPFLGGGDGGAARAHGGVVGYDDGGGVAPDPNYADAIASIESAGSGGYNALGPSTSRGDRAYGRYQVMGNNVPQWTQEALGKAMTPDQFLADPQAQDAVFKTKFGQYVDQTGSPQDAASMWFTGKPLAQGGNRADQLGTTGNQYVDKFNAALGAGVGAAGQAASSDDAPSGVAAYDSGSPTTSFPAKVDTAGVVPMSGAAFSGDSAAPIPAGVAPSASAAPADSGGLLSGHFRFNPQSPSLALMTAGLGMMASQSPTLGGALGAGGLQGVKFLQQQQQNSRENALARSTISTRSGELGQGQQKIDLSAKQLMQQANQFKQSLANQTQQVANQTANTQSEVGLRNVQAAGARYQTIMLPDGRVVYRDVTKPGSSYQLGSSPTDPGGAAPSTGAPTAPAAPSAPMAPVSPIQTKPMPTLGSDAPQAANGAATPTAAPPASVAPAATPRSVATVASIPQGYMPPGYMYQRTDPNEAKVNAELAPKVIEQAQSDAKSAQGSLYMLQEMKANAASVPPGYFGSNADARLAFAKGLNTYLGVLGAQPVDPTIIASGELLAKDRYRLGAELARSLGGREPGFIVQQSVSANPGLENTKVGFQRIISSLEQVQQRKVDLANFVQDWRSKFGITGISAAENEFNKINPPQKYADRALLGIVPPAAVDYLKAHPADAPQFDAKYGPHLSGYFVGQ